MKHNYTQIVILCEDRQQELFARCFLEIYLDIHTNRFRVTHYPKTGQGSGEQSVRNKYVDEITTYRNQSNRKKIALVVFIDADHDTIEQRRRYLNQALSGKKLPAVQANENIAIFIPKYNIETWIAFLKGEMVDENTKYDHLPHQKEAKPYIKTLARNCKHGQLLPDHAPPSLKAACEELAKLR